MRAKIIGLMMTGVLLTGVVNAGIMYPDPDGGWKYMFNGDAAASTAAAALDGKWDHDNGSDEWDGSTIENTGTWAGGVSALIEGGVTFLRIQDPYGYDPGQDPTNRKIMFTHNIETDLGTAGQTIITNGVTLTFRSRLSTTGPLDQRFPSSGVSEAWPTIGDGGLITSEGKGFFGVRQRTGDHIISMSLAKDADSTNLNQDGLVMPRRLAAGGDRATVDTGDTPAGSTVQFMALDPTVWHEFWVTVEPDTTQAGATHKIVIWMDGSFVPAGTFYVTSGNGNDEDWSYLEMGHNMTGDVAAYDIDFFGYTTGVVPPPDPTFNPAPTTVAAPKYGKTYVGQGVQLDGTITDRPPLEGDPGTLSWYWKKEIGPGTVTFAPSATAEDPMASFSAKGMYTLLLQATDGTKDANDVINVWVADRADEKLVGYWDMENTLEDKSVNNNNGTLYHDKRVSAENRFVPDSAVGSASIDLNTTEALPISYFVYLGPAPELDFSTGGPGDFTVTAWVKTIATSQQNVFSKGGDGTNGIRHMLAVAEPQSAPYGRVDEVVDDNVTKYEAISPGVVNDGKWHFIAGQRAGNVIKTYIDGNLVATTNLSGIGYNLSGTSQQGAYIGVGIQQEASAGVANTEPNNVNPKRFLGQIDDVRVYNHTLALDDAAQYASIRSLAAMGPLPATVNAGPDGSFIIKPGLSYQLAGVVTDFGKPDGKTILWTTASGPGGAEAIFANPSSPTSTVTFPAGGVYTLKLTVIDDIGTVEDTAVITTTTPTCAEVNTAGLLIKTDLDGDCYVNIQDLAIMLQNWTQCNDPESLDVNCIWPF